MLKKLLKCFEYQKIKTTYNDKHIFDEFDTHLLNIHKKALRILRNQKPGSIVELRAEDKKVFAQQA